MNSAVTSRRTTAESQVTGFGLSVIQTLDNLLGLTYHLIPEQSQGVSNDNQLLFHSPEAKYKCFQGCSRPVLPQLGL